MSWRTRNDTTPIRFLLFVFFTVFLVSTRTEKNERNQLLSLFDHRPTTNKSCRFNLNDDVLPFKFCAHFSLSSSSSFSFQSSRLYFLIKKGNLKKKTKLQMETRGVISTGGPEGRARDKSLRIHLFSFLALRACEHTEAALEVLLTIKRALDCFGTYSGLVSER